MERAEWLRMMRHKAEALYDHLSPKYWLTFGLAANETHLEYLQKLLGRVAPHSALLSAACGAGRYERSPFLITSTRQVSCERLMVWWLAALESARKRRMVLPLLFGIERRDHTLADSVVERQQLLVSALPEATDHLSPREQIHYIPLGAVEARSPERHVEPDRLAKGEGRADQEPSSLIWQ